MADKKSLVIVESPTKARTIGKYLGKNYTVRSSMGHLIDLPKSRLAVNIDNNFEPDYITIRGRGKILNELKKEAQKSKMVYLAADSDREGEAISYHIKNALEKNRSSALIKRIVFYEITKEAIHDALRHSRDIDMSLVNAQKARRILDRLVGYNLSPLLWEKIKKNLSAGRVQSVALRLICEREAEIEEFVPREYWTIEAEFKKGKRSFIARLVRYDGEKIDIKSEYEAESILKNIEKEDFIVVDVEEKTRKRKPSAPLTTSKLQQAAATKFGFPSRKTMIVAQQLYEGISVKEGPVGLITYMRTDSVRVAHQAQEEARKFISDNYSSQYVPRISPVYKNKKGSQDAHEAIRPTSVFRAPQEVKSYLTKDQLKLYTLIWERFVASQMSEAILRQVKVDIRANGGIFRANGQEVLFDGFLKIVKPGKDEAGKALPQLTEGEILIPVKLKKEVHYTEPPSRYSDASLVKYLEESGIGRPSTYAPIITTLLKRYYIERKNRQFYPTFLGKLTNGLLTRHFPDLLDVEFTSRMEEKLDEIAEGKEEWVNILKDFYSPFVETLEHARNNLESYKGITDEETDYTCEKCGRKMLKRLGRYGFFLACPGFPECRNAKPLPLGKCPREDCGGDIVARKTRRGRKFYGCNRYPDCDFVLNVQPADKTCPRCGSIMVDKNVEKEQFLECLRESCKHRVSIESGKVLQPAN
jgi:DNA topoisomerase-1